MMETTRTSACIGFKMPNGKITYVECRYDGGLAHVGLLLAKHYNDYDKALELISGGNIVSLREDPSDIVRKSPKGCEGLEDCEVMEAYWIGDYLLNANGEYKYLFDKGRWYVVGGLYESDGVTPINRPIPIAKAIEIWM